MGRKKKRKVEEGGVEEVTGSTVIPEEEEDSGGKTVIKSETTEEINNNNNTSSSSKEEEGGAKSSKYAISSHSGEIIREDTYVSDGSEDEEEDVEVVLAGSRSGIMRRGLTAPAAMIQPNRQWVRPGENNPDGTNTSMGVGQEGDTMTQEELERLDPVQRAARLQAEKQRLEQQEKEEERLKESQENAGRDPTLFSKRTAFDIRFDQMEDKPWERANDIADFFNYGLAEDGWLEYAQQQLTIRQELTDASRAKRQPDPMIVPVAPRAPSSQAPRVAVAANSNKQSQSGSGIETETSSTNPSNNNHNDPQGPENQETVDDPNEFTTPLGPSLPSPELLRQQKKDGPLATSSVPTQEPTSQTSSSNQDDSVAVGAGGAWGAGAVPGSLLAKLIQEQEEQQAMNQNSTTLENNNSYYGHDAGMETGEPAETRNFSTTSTYNNNNTDGHYASQSQYTSDDYGHRATPLDKSTNYYGSGGGDMAGSVDHNAHETGGGMSYDHNHTGESSHYRGTSSSTNTTTNEYRRPHWQGGRGGGRGGVGRGHAGGRGSGGRHYNNDFGDDYGGDYGSGSSSWGGGERDDYYSSRKRSRGDWRR